MAMAALVLLLASFIVAISSCDLWLAPSTLDGAGRGIIAGRSYKAEEPIDLAVSLTVPSAAIWRWQLQNYVYASEENDHSMILFGVAMIFNHKEPEMARHFWNEDVVGNASDNTYVPHTIYCPVLHKAARALHKGEEIFITYGGDSWFEDRGINFVNKSSSNNNNNNKEDVKLVSEEDLLANGHCMSDVAFSHSTTTAGQGLFAKRAFRKGEIVTISPVLALPRDEVEALGASSVLMNYCVSTPTSVVALFPIGLGSLANHDEHPNIEMDWFYWDEEEDLKKKKALLDSPPAQVFNSSFAPFDLKYVALRDIDEGEELFIDFGNAWIHSWSSYLVEHILYLERDKEDEEHERSIFRQFISPPKHLFPVAWNRPSSQLKEGSACVDEATCPSL